MAIKKVTVIGAGSVGSTTAYSLAMQGIAHEIVLVDINEEKAKGEAMDIYQGTPLFKSPVNIYAGNYESIAGSDIVVITSGVARKPGQTRIDLAQTNVNIIRSIAPQLAAICPDALYVLVANPVDILTYVFCKVSGIPESRIIGSGTLLDSARLRTRISEYLSVSQQNVHAYVFGEHGESSFIPWSIAQISTVPLQDYQHKICLDRGLLVDIDYDEIDHYMRSSGAKIIKRKGCTNYAIATSVCSICDALSGSVNTVATVSTMLHGEYGLKDVCLSLPVLLGNNGVQGRILPALSEDEMQKLRNSAQALRSVIDQLDIED